MKNSLKSKKNMKTPESCQKRQPLSVSVSKQNVKYTVKLD